MPSHEDFLGAIDQHLAASGMGAAKFGRLVVKDPNFVADLRAGRSPSLAMVERVMTYIADHPPMPAAEPDRAA